MKRLSGRALARMRIPSAVGAMRRPVLLSGTRAMNTATKPAATGFVPGEDLSTLSSFLSKPEGSNGTVISSSYQACKVIDLTAKAGVRLGTVVTFPSGDLGVVTSFDNTNANVVFLQPGAGRTGDEVTCTGDILCLDTTWMSDKNLKKSIAEVMVSADTSPSKGIFSAPRAPLLSQRARVGSRIETGIHALELLYPIAHGQRVLLVGPAGSGKSTFCGTIAKQSGCKVVYSSINSNLSKKGQEMFSSNTISFNADPLAGSLLEAYLSPLVAFRTAEKLRNNGEKVILVLDDLEQHIVLGHELEKLAGGSLPFRPGAMTQSILDCAGNTKDGGSISVIAVANLASAEDLAQLSPAMRKVDTELSSIVDLRLRFDIQQAAKGYYPAIDLSAFPTVSPVLHHQHAGIRPLGKQSRWKLTDALKNQETLEMKEGLKLHIELNEEDDARSFKAFKWMFSQRRGYTLAETYVIFQAANFFYFIGKSPTSDAIAEFQEQVLQLVNHYAPDTFTEIEELLSNPAEDLTYDYLARMNEKLQIVFLDHRMEFDLVRPVDI